MLRKPQHSLFRFRQLRAQPDALEQLQKLAQLKDAGIISEEEFAAKKADLLSKI